MFTLPSLVQSIVAVSSSTICINNVLKYLAFRSSCGSSGTPFLLRRSNTLFIASKSLFQYIQQKEYISKTAFYILLILPLILKNSWRLVCCHQMPQYHNLVVALIHYL